MQLLANEHQYREVANLLDAVKQFMSHFEKYKHIPVISDLNKRIASIHRSLISHIRIIFKEVAEKIDTVADTEILLADLPGGVRTLADACSVIDALGHQVRREFFEDFVRSQLVSYDNLFGHGKQHFALDQVERRWAWFKRLLKYIDSKFATIFPSHWRLPLRLCLEFVERTKMHLILLLTEEENNDQSDVQQLVKALQSALRFEQEMAERFNLLHELKQSRENEELAARQRVTELETQKRLKKESKLMYIPTDHDAENKEEETESGFLGLAHAAISGGISGVFDKFLGAYVTLVRQNLDETVHRLVQDEEASSSMASNENDDSSSSSTTNRVEGHNGKVYSSATGMFVFVKNSIKQCIALSNGHTFLLLAEEFQAVMQHYADILKARCPPETSSQPLGYRLAPNMEIQVSLIINTAEYCAEVAPQLKQMIAAKIIPSLANKIDYAEVEDQYLDLVAHGVKVLVYGLLDRLEPSFRTLMNMNWASFANVGEESAYLLSMNHVLVDAIPKVKRALSTSYFQNFCTKLATEILSRFQDSIIKSKRISDMATQQLLLDTYSLKTLLLALPSLNPAEPLNKAPPPNPVYAKLIAGKAAHIEMMLKLVGTPEEMLVERFRMLWPDGQMADLQMLMALKGTKRNDQQVILEMFGLSKTSNKNAHQPSGGNGAAGNGGAAGGAAGPSHAMAQASNAASQFAASTAAASAAASAAAFSSMKSLTQDLSSQAKNAMTSLKWSNRTQQGGSQNQL